jgi:mannose-6-phosphate isomerase
MENCVSLNRLKDYFVETVLPVWAETAFDADVGQFMEGLQTDGSADPSGVVRTRTAAREIYVFAQASALGVAPEDALDKAERAFANLRATAWIGGDRPGFARTINYKTGTVVDPERDLYDTACVLLALAWLAEATGKPAYNDQIEELIAAMDITLAAPQGGWAEDSAGSIPRRQNPHMHCFESFLALWETDADPAYVARAGELYGLFRARFFHEPTDTLREFFGPTWELSESYGSGRLEPGHMAEWVWLIGRYAQFTGTDLSSLTGRILETTVRLGTDAGTPFLVDESGLDGVPAKNSRRLWPQAELIKAYITQGRATGEERYFQRAEALAAELFETYLAETPRGTWRDCFDLDGRPIATSIPASSLYHLWTAVAELVQSD